MGLDLKNFYLNTPLDEHMYARLSIKYITKEFMDEYNLWVGGPAQKNYWSGLLPPFFLPNDKHETGDKSWHAGVQICMPACKVDMPAREFKFHHFQFRNKNNQVLDKNFTENWYQPFDSPFFNQI